jgi:carbon storage regulator
MLVLSRKPGEKVIMSNGITVTVVAVSGNHVRVGIEAPSHVRILRAELAGRQDGRLDSDLQTTSDWSETTAAVGGQATPHRQATTVHVHTP